MGEAAERVLDAKVDELIKAVVNASFECGEHGVDDEEPYEAVLDRSQAAQAALEEFIAEVRTPDSIRVQRIRAVHALVDDVEYAGAGHPAHEFAQKVRAALRGGDA